VTAAEPASAIAVESTVDKGLMSAMPGGGVATDSKDSPAPLKTGLSFTKEQTTALHKAADKANLWLGEMFGELLQTLAAAIRATPKGRRGRSRNGSNFIASTLYLERDVRDLLDELAETTGRSRANIGRMVIDFETND